MIKIGDRPMLWHIMKIYAHHGLTDFVLCLGYMGYVIKDFFLNYEALTQDFTVPLGSEPAVKFHNSHSETGWQVTLAETGERAQTGARVYRVKKYLGGERFCLTYGDGLGNIDLKGLIRFHESHGKLGTVTGVRPPSRFGELEVSNKQVTSFSEKPQSGGGLINGGFFVFEPAFLDRYLADDDNLSLEQEPLHRLAADGELMMWQHDGFWQPMDTYREWKMLEDMWAGGNAPWKVWS